MVESKYEIRTDLPSVRARRFESDERDLSPTVITTARLVPEIWTRMSLRPYTTPSWWGFRCIPNCLPFVILSVQDALLFPLFESEEYILLPDVEVDFSSSHVYPCSSGPQEWSPKDELDS